METQLPPAPPREAVQRWRLVVARSAIASTIGQREQQEAWETALGASGLPLAGLDGPKPRARIVPAAPLSAAIPGEAELVDVYLVERVPAWRVREALAGHLPEAFRLVDLYDIWTGEAALPGRVVASVYRAVVTLPSAGFGSTLGAAVASLLAAVALPRERAKGDGVVRYDLRPFVEDVALSVSAGGDAATLRMTLRHDPEKGIGRPDEVLAELSARVLATLDVQTLVRESLVLGEAPPPPPPAPRRRPAPRPGGGPSGTPARSPRARL